MRATPRCDVLRAPIEVCCGVLDQLAQLDGLLPPMAQLGDVMLFLVRPGSASKLPAHPSLSAVCASLGIEVGIGV